MGNHLKQPVCIDFYGLPGCGKSTLSHVVAKKLRTVDFDVEETTYNVDHVYSTPYRIIKKVFSTILLLIRYPNVFRRVSKGVPFFSKDYFHHILNIPYKVLAAKSSKALLVFDEGFCQSILSMAFSDEKISYNHYHSVIMAMACNRRMVNVYVKTNPQTSLARIRKRSDGQSRFDYISDVIAMEKLVQLESLCESLPYAIMVDNNNSKDSLDEEANNVVEYLRKMVLQ